jgi:hypothetical protein
MATVLPCAQHQLLTDPDGEEYLDDLVGCYP